MVTSKNNGEEVFEEFEKMVKGGLVPKDLLEKWLKTFENSEKQPTQTSFKKFINANKDLLFKYLDTPPSANVRHSGHFVDQKLKHKPSSNIISLLEDVRSVDLKNKIQNKEIEVKTFGVQLSPTEDRLLNALQRLLHEKSQTDKPGASDYYLGNETAPLIPYGGEKKASPTICVKPSELYKAYFERPNYSSHEIKHVRDSLAKLESKKFLIQYKKRRKEIRKGKKVDVFDMVEEHQSLVKIVKFVEGVEESYENDDKKIASMHEKKGGVVISLNPILVDQINSKYIEYPKDINKRMSAAAGGSRSVTESMNLLRDFLLRARSAKQKSIEIEEEKLIYTLRLDGFWKRRQKKRVKDKMEDAIEVSKKLGILSKHSISTNKLGLPKHIFELNPDFNRPITEES